MNSYPIFQPSIPPPPTPAPPEAWIALAIAVICLAVGVGLVLWVARRNFYRNNAAGIQEFENFRSAVWCGIVEGLAKLVAVALFMGGCFAGLQFLALFFP